MNHPDAPTAAPCVMVIFGATGDLTKRKLLPALCNLAKEELLPKQFAIVGFAGNDFDTESFRKKLSEDVPNYAASPFPRIFGTGSSNAFITSKAISATLKLTSASSSKSKKPTSATTPKATASSTWPSHRVSSGRSPSSSAIVA